MRRMMYHWHRFKRVKVKLLFKFYSVQKFSPSKCDWALQVQKDKADLNLNFSELEIKSMSCEKFKSILKQKIDETAMCYLKNKRKEKTKDIDINNFKPKEYLMSKNLSVTEVQNLYKLRNCMIDVKGNFHSGNKDNMWCRTCNLFTDTTTSCGLLPYQR